MFSTLIKNGHTVFGYIDDTFLQGDTFAECQTAVFAAVSLFSELGFVVHNEKSEILPKQEINFLGFTLNSLTMTVSITPERKCKTKQTIQGLLNAPFITIRELAEVIGILVANLPGVTYGRLYYRHLECNKIKSLRSATGDFNAKTTLTSLSRLDLVWWLKNIDEAFCHIYHGPVGAVLECDACTSGWGAVLKTTDQPTANGLWSCSHQKFHINVLELLAIYFGLQALCKSLRGHHVGIRSDNMTAVSYINHMGGTKSYQCNDVTKLIWLWCKNNDIWISAAHIPGTQNTIADCLSRRDNINTEWALNNKTF